MTKVPSICLNCGAAIDVLVGQSVVGNQLAWSQGHRCAICGDAVEADGEGDPPAEIVEALLAAEGEWELWLAPADSEKLRALRALRVALDLELKDVMEWKSKFPGPVVAGTKTHMAWLVKILQQDGI